MKIGIVGARIVEKNHGDSLSAARHFASLAKAGEEERGFARGGLWLMRKDVYDAVGGLGQRLLLLEELHPFAELGDDLRADLRQALERLGEHQARDDVVGLGEAELEVAGEDLAFAAEEARRDAVDRAAAHGEELLEAQ